MSTHTYQIGKEDGNFASQTMVFRDGNQQWTAELPQGYDKTRDVAINDDTTLASFFERPIFTTAYSWAPGDPVFYVQIDPWSVFFAGSRVINRLNNFNLMTANLCVKILINGNPFYYGRLMSDYRVLPGLDVISDVSSGVRQLITASQRLHAYIDPASSEGVIMKLPFIYGRDTLNVTTSDWSKLGRLFIREVNALKHANGATAPVEISVSIWATDVKLSVPTTLNSSSIVNQSGDEYGKNAISNKASALSAMMGKASMAPVIGPYARATSDMISSLGDLAKMFGYSRPAIISDAMQMRAMPVGPMANTDRGDSVTKLTLDSKQELTIDPSTFGIKVDDELTLLNLVTKESYLTRFTWPIISGPGTHLWNSRVTCNLGSGSPGVTGYYMTPMQFASRPFAYWRGTIKFRFQIVASAYHRGRLRFVYDPNYVANLDANVAYTRIVDLENERDFTMEISWAHNLHYLPTGLLVSDVNLYSTTAFNTINDACNGVLGVYVLNNLTSPNSVANNDIQINVSVSMCDDADFAVPSNSSLDTYTFSPATTLFNTSIVDQGGNEPGEEDQSNAPEAHFTDEQVQHCFEPDATNLVYFGESVKSFRALLKRYNYLTSYRCPVAPGAQAYIVERDFPVWRGEFASAYTATSTAILYNYAKMTLLNYLAPAFVGYRGGLRSKYFISTSGSTGNMFAQIVRRNDKPARAVATFGVDIASDSKVAASYTNFDLGLTGVQAQIGGLNPSIEVEFPYYVPYRFDSTRGPLQNTLGGSSQSHVLYISGTPDNTASVHRFISVGEDFQLFLFQGVPPVYIRAQPTPG